MSDHHITIIGAGVIGLTTGISLLLEGFGPVSIVARDLSPNTTSDVAAAFWYPYRTGGGGAPLRWATRTFDRYLELLEKPGSGISMKKLVELFDEPPGEQWWASAVKDLRNAGSYELPAPFRHGLAVSVPLIDTPVHMPFLMSWFRDLGGNIEQKEFGLLAEAAANTQLLINCSGVWAKTLAEDDLVTPVRGQVVRTSLPSTGADTILVYETELEMTYIVPRITDCILGGTAIEGDWDRTPREETARSIVARCTKLLPSATTGTILSHHVGLRPGRPEVRLEAILVGTTKVIHNYGHGGAGFTLAWGCAEDVVALCGQ